MRELASASGHGFTVTVFEREDGVVFHVVEPRPPGFVGPLLRLLGDLALEARSKAGLPHRTPVVLRSA